MNKPVYLGQAISDISKTLMYNFGVIILNPSTKIMQDYATWTLIALILILKLKIFIKKC